MSENQTAVTLTERQRDIYEFIREKIEGRGYGPTIREIGAAFNIKSPNGVMCHLKALEKKGLIRRQGRSARAIQIDDIHAGGATLPYLGVVAAGATIEAPPQEERLDLGDMFTGRNHYALKVRGQSMVDQHIEDGDIVIIRKQNTAENGEKVVAMVDKEVTLKKFFKKRDHIRLEAANGTMPPIIVKEGSDVEILGVLVGVLRRV